MENTINDVFARQVKKYGNRTAIEKKMKGRWESVSWNEYYERARACGMAFLSFGVKKGDRIALLSENRLEWLYTDMGAMGIGACVVPIYSTLLAEEVGYIVDNSEAGILVVEDREQLEKGLAVFDQCPSLTRIIVMDDDAAADAQDYVMPFSGLLALGRKEQARHPGRFESLRESVIPDDLATIVYTSGTTGVPKGAMITHKNIISVIRSLDKIKPGYAGDKDHAVPFLPLSHVFERVAGHFYGMYMGITSSYCESISTFQEDVKEKRPTIMLAVPRVCEKVYQKIIMQVETSSVVKQKLFWWGHGIGTRISEMREKKQAVPKSLRLQYRIAYQLIFKKLRQALGGRIRWMTASGAPTSREIILFFNAAGIQVVEGYGMTECTAPATMSNLNDYRIGTVGKPLPDVDVQIAEDGEILIKGDNVFAGYWKMEAETKEVFTEDGYLKSGDIGEFDEEGFLRITDRKKNLIITSGGKNIAPQKIEQLFMSDPLFAHFMVIGDRKKFLSALITLNPEVCEQIANDAKIPFEKPEELLENQEFMAFVENRIQEKNEKLARYETIKKYRIIPREFSQEEGELTPSMKLKRRVIMEKFQEDIESMYE